MHIKLIKCRVVQDEKDHRVLGNLYGKPPRRNGYHMDRIHALNLIPLPSLLYYPALQLAEIDCERALTVLVFLDHNQQAN